MPSTEDDLASIERSARSSFGTTPQAVLSKTSSNNISPMNETKGHRESSMGSVDTFDSKNYDRNDLVVGFATKNDASILPAKGTSGGSSKAKQRNSVTLNPVAMSALAGLDDSDLDDSGDEKDKASEPDRNPNPKASGGPEHRPLVGGFAAAAYEAARVDFYKKKGMDVRGHPPPRPRNFPRYP